MWPKLVATKILSKTLGTNNFVFPTTTNINSSQDSPSSNSISTLLHHHQDTQDYKVFVSTWNVGGIAPPDDLDMEDLLDSRNNPCDIYVLGFQELVPLNTANVLGKENCKICKKWNSLIKKTLNKKTAEFRCLTSKKMVGIFISIWVRSDIHPYIQNPSVSCVGCGIMGCLGNKGSVSIRFHLHETSFCFVCTHLASGDREGDERNRNANAADLFARTNFSRGGSLNLPTKILDHDRVIILGDLNYRISMPEPETRQLVNKGEWDELVQNDQLRRELDGGQVFKGWHEGAIKFAPTYKYFPNSDNYYCCGGKKGEKKRSPAWCDRIIWFGEEQKQLLYTRGESKLSDHRPVKSVFMTQVRVSRISTFENVFLSERFNQIALNLKMSLKDDYQCNKLSNSVK